MSSSYPDDDDDDESQQPYDDEENSGADCESSSDKDLVEIKEETAEADSRKEEEGAASREGWGSQDMHT